MSFDTDYLNSQKEKLNESISNVICLTYLMCPVSKNKTCCCFQTFKDLLAFLLLPFFNWECKCRGFFISTKFIIPVCNFCEQKRIEKSSEISTKYFKNYPLFFSGLQRYKYIDCQPIFFHSFITNDCERNNEKNSLKMMLRLIEKRQTHS